MRDSTPGLGADEMTVRTQARSVSRSSRVAGTETWRRWGGIAFALFLLAVFTRPLLSMFRSSATSELNSYPLLIPFVSAYLLYIRRAQLPKRYATDVPFGVLFLAAGLGILAFTWLLDIRGPVLAHNERMSLSALSFLFCLVSGGFFFLGRAWMRAAAFPLAYLIFMLPLPEPVADALEQASATASADMANLLFHLSGTPFLREGQIFQLPNITLEVAQECSGIRSSLVLFITSVLAANLFLKTTWRRLALVAIVIPLGILRNGFRILVIGLLCVHVGPQMIHSLIHRRGGPLFFVLSLVPLLLVLWWLRRGDGQARHLKAET
jgi:exosortase C (VPDSG-CTERM-specific)